MPRSDTERATTTIMLRPDQPFDLDRTLSCGQAFRWEKVEGWWQGIVNGRAISIRQDERLLTFSGVDAEFVGYYFRLDQDLSAILSSINRDPVIGMAIQECRGLRLVRQQPWECLVSYICATNTNIPAVKRRVSLMAERFGRPVDGPFGTVYTFPEPEVLASVSHADLRDCRLGYRTEYVSSAAVFATEHPGWTKKIAPLPFEDARQALMELRGVGPKAADCVLLFAFGFFEAFPVDVWIHRIMAETYLPDIAGKRCTPADYERIRRFARDYFGEFAGYAQEYLYCVRDRAGQKRGDR
ncbi:MAG TPA: DNA glycosylase [Candidatus Methanoculleus thermohydrogenotrophicum]|jgi:N-glycosylase/DNA lyase|nr:DNA glycosylase [Candidatus Methanoculleus thermohydrogenotrophicum]NLM82685.1 8-oxoguanine DNA glycosylase [Candidatus Methanoculleus thermohydrogenotrophicum]HOB17703.1 DNA glycosylase [Candidatus Methanoculleus thermohydrogenotrophicum]HPZ37940.1 DNA glycosylase [Candidatus Methanoculleus thermohydrogenotrophicum]HQC91123.1 DNA glycosylase [Candidatus Methanoculleus thermohydrogenotrophicum]